MQTRQMVAMIVNHDRHKSVVGTSDSDALSDPGMPSLTTQHRVHLMSSHLETPPCMHRVDHQTPMLTGAAFL